MKPILFNTEMVQAILEDRKTTTRRCIKNIIIESKLIKESVVGSHVRYELFEVHNGEPEYDSYYGGSIEDISYSNAVLDYSPYRVGEILYVRETFHKADDGYHYKAGFQDSEGLMKAYGYKWKPSLHMPKEAARIFLEVTNIRAERLLDMDIQGAINEGINTDGIITTDGPIKYRVWNRMQELWDSTIKKQDMARYGSDANPWVWVVEFKKISKESAHDR